MPPDDLQDVILEAARSWLDGAVIPRRFKTITGRYEEIPHSVVLTILRSTDRAGMHTGVSVNGVRHSIYATLHQTRIWVDRNWNTDPPTIEMDDAIAVLSVVAHQMRDRQVAEEDERRYAPPV